MQHIKNLEQPKCLAEKMVAQTRWNAYSTVEMSEACADIETLPKRGKWRNKDVEQYLSELFDCFILTTCI